MSSSIENVQTLESIREAADGLDKRVRSFARKRPIVAVLSALLLGFIAARVTSRRGR
jgi:hypothetical protein